MVFQFKALMNYIILGLYFLKNSEPELENGS